MRIIISLILLCSCRNSSQTAIISKEKQDIILENLAIHSEESNIHPSKLYKYENKVLIRNEGDVKRYLDTFSNFNRNNYSGDILSLQREMNLFIIMCDLCNKSGGDREAHKKLKQMQSIEFPIMRQKYAETLKQNLWIEDIKVRCYGKKNEKIGFYGNYFYTNKNVKEFLINLEKPIKMLRFEYMYFSMYKGTDGERFYIDAPNDTSIIGEYYY